VAAYLTVVATAAIAILIHPKPELLPLSLLACGTSALARKHATAGHRLKVNNFVSVK